MRQNAEINAARRNNATRHNLLNFARLEQLVLDIKNLSVRYKTARGDLHAVSGVSFNLDGGKSMGIAGESACGKSTLGLAILRALQGRYDLSGSILLDSKQILQISEREFDRKIRWKRVSMIFQGALNSLDPVFTVHEQIAEALKEHGYDGDLKTATLQAVQSVGLGDDVLNKYPHELSGGMKQRVVIAAALLLHPALVIADEPTTSLDVLIQAQIINRLKQLKDSGVSIVMISHDLAVLSEIADVIGIMYGGEMVEFGSSHDIYKEPKHPYTKRLLESIPMLAGDRPKHIPGSPPDLTDLPTGCVFCDRCPEAIDKCKTKPPEIKTDSGYVKCWLYE